MIKFIKLIIGLLFLPFCVAVSRCAYLLLTDATNQDFSTLSPEEWALPAGFGLWVIIYLLFPKPWRAYVLGHELTHALWGLLMGARIGRMKVDNNGGSVELSKTNFLISLAPYFFPLYTVIVIALYGGINFLHDLSDWRWLGLALVGFTWSFHVTFTLAMLTQQQSDVQENGRIFSYTIIYLFNLLGVCCWITAVGEPNWSQFIETLLAQSTDWYRNSWKFFCHLPENVENWIETVRQLIYPH